MQRLPDIFDYFGLAADVATVIGVIGVVVGIIGAIIAYQNYKSDHKRKGLENAITLAKIYEKEIINEIAWIESVFQISGINKSIYEIINTNTDDLSFSYDELVMLSKNERIEETFYNEFNKIKTNNIDFAYGFYHNRSTLSATSVISAKSDGKPKAGTEQQGNDENLFKLTLFINDICDLLNSLEWFAMNFKTKIADESVVYQSLHQTFLSCVRFLYFFIASKNKNMYDKTYTNIQWLYNLWNKKQQEQALREAKAMKDAERDNAVRKKSIEKALEHTSNSM
jgi:hypothetical protein